MKLRFVLIITLLFAFGISVKSQTAKTNDLPLIQFSGVVLDQDSLTPIPFVAILIKNTKRGTVSDFYGFFSVVLSPGDELEFHSVTHKVRSYQVPDTLRQKYYYAIQVLAKDTIQLPMVEVHPWPSKDEFKRAFLNLDLSNTDYERAENNLQRDALSYLERNQTADAALNYKYVMQAYYTKVYTAGQQPVNNLLNPLKWAEFIDAWRKGKLKVK
ncbi:MAG: carboxypeptidase-like regulatory domain-containing protein [Bacteroidetes bacterium]|nr:carboxypeptidase-like regulatory domain-containing protein [Bacteroidota bacterium]